MARRKQVTVLVGHFDDLIVRGLRALVEEDASLRLVRWGVEPEELRALLRSRRPSVAIVDRASLASPAEVRELAEAFPRTRLVLLAERLSSAECAQLLAFGAAACLSKSTQSRDVLNAVHLAAREMHLTPREVEGSAVSASGDELTPREVEVQT